MRLFLLDGAGSEGVEMETEVSLKASEVSCDESSKGDAAGLERAVLADGESSSLSQVPAVSNGDDSEEGKEMVELKIIWNKNKYDLKMPLDGTGAKLKERIHTLTGKKWCKCVNDVGYSSSHGFFF